MTYQDMMSHIYGLARFGMKPGLERIRATLRALSDPQDAVQTVHVAGTNGKGSTAAFLASILTSGGHKVGLFTSPHLVAFTERIRINGTEISENEVVSLADRILSVAPEGTTFFEIVTAMAYLFFAEQGVGAAVMEVGMGGRFDATNIASGILSIITPIALDHSQYLGETISMIAREKAGVIKAGCPVVSSSQSADAREVIRQHCMGMKSPLYLAGSDFNATWESDGLAYSGINWNLHALHPGIPGRYQAMNLATAICVRNYWTIREFLSPLTACERVRKMRSGREEWKFSPVDPAFFSTEHTTRQERKSWRKLWLTSPGERLFWWQALSETRTQKGYSSRSSPLLTLSLQYVLRFRAALPHRNLQFTAGLSATRQSTPVVLPRDWKQLSIKLNRMI